VACSSSQTCTNGFCSGSLSVEYLCNTTNASFQQIEPHFKIANTGSSAVPLSSLKVRYFFTHDSSTGQVFACDYALIGCSNMSGNFYPWTGGGTGADTYLEITFTSAAGSVSPGSDSGELQPRFYDVNYVYFNQANDYSFDPTKTAYTNWTHMTLYENGTLVWGTEP
jgi:hypothetical protein